MSNLKKTIANSLIILLLVSCNNLDSEKVRIEKLKTERLTNPIGIDDINPNFQWILKSNLNDQIQTAYRIVVSSTPNKLNNDNGDLWDSERVDSDNSINVKYAGIKLGSSQQVFWKVKVWDKNGVESDWSEPASFSMGLLNPGDWKGKWIGLDKAVGDDNPEMEKRKLSARYLRKEFETKKEIKKATAYIVGLGLNELYINGNKVGTNVLSPGLTGYDKRALYVTYDVTQNMANGNNAIGVILGNGRYFAPRHKVPTLTITYGFPKLLLQIKVEYADGTTENIVSDESWKLTADGPIIENNEYDGEVYDARKELKGWCSTGYNDSAWINAEIVEKASEHLSSEMNEPIRVTGTIKPLEVTNPKPGMYIYDMGQNMVGWVKLTVKGKSGDEVKMRFAETLEDDGTLYLTNIRGANVTDRYILKGDGVETFEPRFVFHGFRYVEVTGYPSEPTIESIEGKTVNDDVKTVGSFTCSNELINQIYKNSVWGIKGNYRSIPTDCPQRDERQGWLGDRAVECYGESYMFDISKLYRKWLRDIFDAQKESGSVSCVNPAYWLFYIDDITWSGTPSFLIDMLYRQYGNTEIISENYVPLKKWVDYMINLYMENDLMPRDTYGDWCVPPLDPKLIHTKDPERLTSGELLGSSYFYEILKMMTTYAKMIDKPDDEKHYSDLAAKLKIAFNNEFLNKETFQYGNNSATSNLLALAFNLVPSGYEKQVFKNIVHKIEVEHNSHITTGLIGQQNFNRILTKYGRADLAFTVNTQTDYPSYGYMIENGATTIWELWNGNTADPAMNSGNHLMLLGDFVIWLYEDLAGIKSDYENPGFKHIIMKPTIIDGLNHVAASHKSQYGIIKSEWKIEGNEFNWDVTIPANTTATIYIPGEETPQQIGSGTYNFASIVNK